MEIRQAISMYLTAKAYKEEDFKVKFENPDKNLDECVAFVTYMMYKKAKEQVEKEPKAGAKAAMGCVIPSDDEVFALATQYYMDDDLKVTDFKFFDAELVSVSATTFTDEEKAEMRKEAIKKYQDDVIAEQKKKDQERKEKASKAKKPAAPIIVPDVKEGETSEEKTNEEKPKVVQMDLFDNM